MRNDGAKSQTANVDRILDLKRVHAKLQEQCTRAQWEYDQAVRKLKEELGTDDPDVARQLAEDMKASAEELMVERERRIDEIYSTFADLLALA